MVIVLHCKPKPSQFLTIFGHELSTTHVTFLTKAVTSFIFGTLYTRITPIVIIVILSCAACIVIFTQKK
jgi:hypothetical protein